MSDQLNKKPGYEKVGDTFSITVTVTGDMIDRFADVTGDKNPIHVDAAYAATTPFKQRLAHGMLLAGFISRALVEGMPPEGGIYLTQELKFVNPVFINDTITVDLKVESLHEKRGIAGISTIVKKQTGEICVKGVAQVLYTRDKKTI